MLFNAPEFLFVFLPATLGAFLLLRRFEWPRLSILMLCIASLAFYGWTNPAYLVLIGISLVVNLGFARAITSARTAERPAFGLSAKTLLIASLAFNLGLLAYFKYADFFLQSLAATGLADFPLLKIALPLGISFFTFQQVAYQVDAYQGKITSHHPLEYVLFVTFFPQLIAGPIVHHSEMMPQFTEAHQRARNRIADIQIGLFIFAVGLFKKVVIADTIAQVSSPVYASAATGAPVEFIAAWVAALGFTAQIYFDFSGYCDMATGAARMFGIKLPANFFSPYQSRSIVEFWRRWHITLSRFLRDYLYIPLGGNRQGEQRRQFNLMATMVLGGLWHGAGWTFVFWGFLHGVFLAVNHAWTSHLERTGQAQHLADSRLYGFAAWLLTMLCVVVAWVFFRAESFSAATNILSGMVGLNGLQLNPSTAQALVSFGLPRSALAPYISGKAMPLSDLFVGIVMISGALWAASRWRNVYQTARLHEPIHDSDRWLAVDLNQNQASASLAWLPNSRWATVTGILAALALMTIFSAAPSEFLYFRF